MTLGDILKHYREEHKISMDDFSKCSSLSKGYISMLENNINPRNNKPIVPTLTTIKKLANGMNIDVDSLLKKLDGRQEICLNPETEFANGHEIVKCSSEMDLSGLEKEIILSYRQADDISQMMVLRVLGIDEKYSNVKGESEKLA